MKTDKNKIVFKFTPEAEEYYEQSSDAYLNRVNQLSATELQNLDKNYELLNEIVQAFGEAQGVSNINFENDDTAAMSYETVRASGKKLAELYQNPKAKKLIDILFKHDG